MLSLVSIFVLISLSQSQSLLDLDEGDTCKTGSEGPWICRTLKKCSHVDVRVSRPSICSFNGRDPIICCPPAIKKISKAELSCMKYNDDCKADFFRNKHVEAHSSDNSSNVVIDVKKDSVTIERPEASKFSADELPSERITSLPTVKTSEDIKDSLTTTEYSLSSTAVKTDTDKILNASILPGSVERFTTPKAIVANTGVNSGPQDTHVTNAATTAKIEPLDAEDQARNPTKPPRPLARQFVVGGHYSLPGQRRYMVLIGYGEATDISWRCGGSLISDIWVLTAAHCTDGGQDIGKARWARLGELDYSTNADDARLQDRRIVQHINHPGYKPPVVYNDIALHKLDSPVIFDQYVAPICLQTTFDIPQLKATVVGWGRMEFAGDVSSKLMEADITLINDKECNKMWGDQDQATPNGIDPKTMICAGEKEGGKDACSGDSGGPLVVNQPGTCLKKQVGVTSFGRDCGLPNTPGIYTRVSAYIPWIESIVWP